MRRLLPALAAACVAGSLLPVPWALACALVLAAAAPSDRRSILFTCALALALSSVNSAWRDPVARPFPRGVVSLGGTVVDAPQDERARFILAGTPYGTLEVRAGERMRAGERVRVRGRFLRFGGVPNPGQVALRERLRERGIGGLFDGRVESRAPGQGALAGVARLRTWAQARLAVLPPPAAALLDGALVGERSALDDGVAQAFAETGTMHVLVTAGLHLGAFAALLSLACEALGTGRVAASLLALCGVALFVALSGAHLPAVRAGVMVVCALLARATGRAALGPDAIALAAIVVTLLEPWSVRGASFALSFSCVVAIALFAAPIEALLERLRMPNLAREGVAMTLSTQIGVWPLQAAYFLQMAPYAPLANALVVPAVAPALGFGMLTVVHPAFAPLAALACGWILGAVRLISAFPFAHLPATPPPWWAIAAYDGAALWLGVCRTRTALMATLCAAALCLWPPRGSDRALRIVALDVGQGQAIAVLSQGRATMVDGAPAPQGALTLVPFLLRAGIHRIDALVVSHPHQDHLAGFSAVIATLRVDRLVDGGWPARGAFGVLVHDARLAHVPVVHLRAGSVWHTGDAEIAILAPFAAPLRGTNNDVDNDSLIVRVRRGGCTALIMGDAEAEEEHALLDAYPPEELRTDVLVVGHHGSAYSSSAAFLAAVRPRIAITSVGRHNPYGLPSPKALARLRDVGARALLTSREGAIDLRLKNGAGGTCEVLR